MTDQGLQLFISHEVLADQRTVVVRLSRDAHFRHMVAHFRGLIQSQPELGCYDYVCDLTDFRGEACVEDVNTIARDYAPYAASDPTYTCFATRDPHFALWAKSMDDLFRGRRHLVFSSVDECLGFLKSQRGAPRSDLQSPLPEIRGETP